MRRTGWRRAIIVSVLLACCATGVAAPANADGFSLTATAADLATYFPGELGNGYFSTFTAPRGTEGSRSYVGALMAYGANDVSRPAAVPGWTGIDYRIAPTATWLNQAPLLPATFQDYHQTLDLHDASLTTRYRYVDRRRATRVRVVSFISAAAPHLAAIELSLTPEFSGTVELSFPLRSWTPHEPRLALARLTAEQLPRVLDADGLSLRAAAPATPDRAALWYPGRVRILAASGDADDLTLQLTGRAHHGLHFAEAVAVGLPRGLKPLDVRVDKDPSGLELDLRLRVVKGQSYTFDKYVALSRSGWGGDGRADLALAAAARGRGFASLLAAQRAAWAKLWQSDIRIDGDPRAQLAVHADLYYLLANVAPSGSWGVGACGLTTGYFGHVFWDSDSWIFPALMLLHPRRARTLVMFRDRTLDAAEARARAAGLAGAKYPWESDPQNGSGQVMAAAQRLGVGEIHVSADIAIAQWQYWLASHDRAWLRRDGWPVLRAVAEFWTSRATWNATRQRYDIRNVVSVMEPYAHVDDDAFTNASVAKALRIATRAAAVVGVRPDPRWTRIADKLYIPFATAGQHHQGFARGQQHAPVNDDLAFLAFPSLDLAMAPAVRRNDYRLAVAAVKKTRETPGTMGLAPLAIAAAATGDIRAAAHWLALDITPSMLKPPFAVRTETPTNNTGYFLTGSAGYIQALVYGLTGLRIERAGLIAAYPPSLPPGWRSLTLQNVSFRGRRQTIRVARDAAGQPRLQHTPF